MAARTVAVMTGVRQPAPWRDAVDVQGCRCTRRQPRSSSTSAWPASARTTVAQARARADVPAGRVEPIAQVVDTTVPGPAGSIPVRVHTPAERPLGVVVYLHGGGHVTGTIDSYDGLTRPLANRTPATVVSVGYRRVPSTAAPPLSRTPKRSTPGPWARSASWHRTATAGSRSPGTVPAATTPPCSPAGCATPVPGCHSGRPADPRAGSCRPSTRAAVTAPAAWCPRRHAVAEPLHLLVPPLAAG